MSLERFMTSFDDYIAGKLWFAERRSLNDPMEEVELGKRFKLEAGVPVDDAKINRYRDTLNDYKVCSMTRFPDNFAMWSHYANTHTGVCLGFNIDISLLRQSKILLKNVEYEETIPIVADTADGNISRENLWKLFGYKHQSWNYEEEWRLLANKHEARMLPIGRINAILLGYKCKLDREKIIKWLGDVTINVEKVGLTSVDQGLKLTAEQFEHILDPLALPSDIQKIMKESREGFEVLAQETDVSDTAPLLPQQAEVLTSSLQTQVAQPAAPVTQSSQTAARQTDPSSPAPAAPLPAVKSDMVLVQHGTFPMGDPDAGPGPKVTISKSFYLGRCEVTQKEWRDVMNTDPCFFDGDSLPVENVTWYDAVEFCIKKSEKEGLKSPYKILKDQEDPNNLNDKDFLKWTVTWDKSANGYRLPIEAEWEFAARGGESNTTYKYAGSDEPDTVAWYNLNSRYQTHEVGKKRPNELGLYDMSGNVWEWCWDWYADYPSGEQSDPDGAPSGRERVNRGGNWDRYEKYITVTFRNKNEPWRRYKSNGFRLAQNAE